jgi:hypothetical protein
MMVFKTEDATIEINGKTIPVKVSYAKDYDDEMPDFDYGTPEENAAEMKRFESYELSNLLLKVTASALGENGYDSLGQVFVVSDKADEQLLETANEHGMKETALHELKINLLYQYNVLKQAFGE